MDRPKSRGETRKYMSAISKRAYFAIQKSLYWIAKKPILGCERAYFGSQKSLFWKQEEKRMRGESCSKARKKVFTKHIGRYKTV